MQWSLALLLATCLTPEDETRWAYSSSERAKAPTLPCLSFVWNESDWFFSQLYMQEIPGSLREPCSSRFFSYRCICAKKKRDGSSLREWASESSCSRVSVGNRSTQLFKGGSSRLHSTKIFFLTCSVSSERVRIILIRIKNDSHSGSREKGSLRLTQRKNIMTSLCPLNKQNCTINISSSTIE